MIYCIWLTLYRRSDSPRDNTCTTMSFSKYPSIKGDKDGKHVSKQRKIFGDEQFVVTEKIHGANLQVLLMCRSNDSESKDCDSDDSESNDFEFVTKIGKRTGYILSSEFFYNCDTVIEQYKDDLKTLWERICDEKKIVETSEKLKLIVRVYGELYGGSYPECESKKQLAKRVQKGIYYHYENDFMVFDISVASIPSGPMFIKYTDTVRLMKGLSLAVNPVIYAGGFDPCLEFCRKNVKFATTIPKMHGLDEIKDNFAEGYVMKANIEQGVQQSRSVIKIKNPAFSEIIRVKGPPVPDQSGSKEFIEHLSNLSNYVTQNRYDNTVSKFGPDTNPHKLIGHCIHDAREEYAESLSDESNKSLGKVWKQLFKKLRFNPLFEDKVP